MKKMENQMRPTTTFSFDMDVDTEDTLKKMQTGKQHQTDVYIFLWSFIHKSSQRAQGKQTHIHTEL